VLADQQGRAGRVLHRNQPHSCAAATCRHAVLVPSHLFCVTSKGNIITVKQLLDEGQTAGAAHEWQMSAGILRMLMLESLPDSRPHSALFKRGGGPASIVEVRPAADCILQ
jgi:hypothetical protein